MTPQQFTRQRAILERSKRGPQWVRKAMARLILEAKATAVFDGGRHIGWRMTDGRVACIKWRYRDQAGALVELAAIARLDQAWKKPQRAYRCPYCQGWHLTSRV